MEAILLVALPCIDLAIIYALIYWRARGKPLPAKLMWLKRNKLTASIFNRWQAVPIKL